MAAPRGRVQREEQSEEVKKSALDVYGDISTLIADLYQAALELENNESVAALLKAVEVVKVNVDSAVEQIKMDMQMAEDAARYESEEDKNG